MGRRGSTIVVGFVVAAAAIACSTFSSDNDPEPPPQPGERLGTCLEGNKCNAGLECRLPERICLTPGEPVPPNVDASVPDGRGPIDSTPSDAPDDGTKKDATPGMCTSTSASVPGPQCGAVHCADGPICCVTNGSTDCLDKSSCIGGQVYACDNGGCGAGPCCLKSPTNWGTGGACSRTITATGTSCVGQCTPTEHRLCTTKDECADHPTNRNCELVEVTTGNPNFKPIWRICVP